MDSGWHDVVTCKLNWIKLNQAKGREGYGKMLGAEEIAYKKPVVNEGMEY